jgi:hypothetical protein
MPSFLWLELNKAFGSDIDFGLVLQRKGNMGFKQFRLSSGEMQKIPICDQAIGNVRHV